MWEYVNIYLQICVLAAALGDVIGVAQIFFANKKGSNCLRIYDNNNFRKLEDLTR